MKRITLSALFKWPRKPPAPIPRIAVWSELGRDCIALHIADASSSRARKGWAEAKRLREDWRIIP